MKQLNELFIGFYLIELPENSDSLFNFFPLSIISFNLIPGT